MSSNQYSIVHPDTREVVNSGYTSRGHAAATASKRVIDLGVDKLLVVDDQKDTTVVTVTRNQIEYH